MSTPEENYPGPTAEQALDRKLYGEWDLHKTQSEDENKNIVEYSPFGQTTGVDPYDNSRVRLLPFQGAPDMTELWPPDQIGEDWKTSLPDPDRGEALHRYQLPLVKSELTQDVDFVRYLGKGFFGSVWEVIARHRSDNRYDFPQIEVEEEGRKKWEYVYHRFACKLIRPSINTPRSIQQSIQDMLILRYMRHKNLCNMADIIGIADRKTGYPYSVVCLILELCDGDLEKLHLSTVPYDFDNRKDKWVFSEKLTRHLFTHIVRGLAYLHSNNICRLDIKSGNILYKLGDHSEEMAATDTTAQDELSRIVLSSTFKLADFGISRLINEVKDDKKFILKWYKKDIYCLLSILNRIGIPDSPYMRHMSRYFLSYCRNGQWMDGFPEEWKTLSSEMKDMYCLLSDAAQEKWDTPTMADIVKHAWVTAPRTSRRRRFTGKPFRKSKMPFKSQK